MTVEQFAWGLGLFITVSGALWAIWWRIEGRVKEAKTEATLKAESAAALATTARQELADHKLHVAETYVSKAGHRESTEQIMAALNNVKTAVDGTNQRIDRLFEASPKRTRSTQ